MPGRPAKLSIWLMCLSVLAYVPGGFVRFTFPKLMFVALAILFAFLAPRVGRLPRPIWLIVASGGLVMVIAAFASNAASAALYGRWPRYEGVPVLLIYLGAAAAGARLFGPSERRSRLRDLHLASACVSVVIFLLSALESLGLPLVGRSDAERAGSVLGNATDQGLVAMMFSALLLIPAVRDRSIVMVAGFVAALSTVVLSGSRSAMLATGLALILQAVIVRGVVLRVAATSLGLGTVATLAIPDVRDRLLQSHTVTGRRLLWEETSALAKDHPWFGVGPSHFVDSISRYQNAEWVRSVGVENPPDSPHSWPLQALSAGGPLLCLAALILAGAVILYGSRVVASEADRISLGLLGATVGYGTGLLVNFTTPGPTCVGAFLVGALVARDAAQEKLVVARAMLVIAAAIAAMAAASASLAEVQLQHGLVSASEGDLESADRSFQRAATWRPLDPDIAMIAASAFAARANLGQPTAGALTLRWSGKSLKRTPDSYDSGLARAVGLISEGRLPEANRQLNRLIEAAPVRPGAYVQRGITRFGLRDVVGARSDLHRAQRLNPDDPTATAVLAEIDSRLGIA